MNLDFKHTPLMILGTSSGAGKTLIATAICRYLKRKGEKPIPFKGQNMSNNAWVDSQGREMAYSQALQAWSAGLEPSAEMNPVLLKPKGDCTSEVIHLGKSVGTTQAINYYEDWFNSGWEAIKKGLTELLNNKDGRLILEGAGSPVEVNLQHKDLTNLKLAKFLRANCILVADIERGGVFAQIIGTIALMKPEEKSLIKGIIINRFRGDKALFETGVTWIEKETGIPVLGILPWLKEIFPPEDSLDLLERQQINQSAEIEIAIIKLPRISNFSDLDPLFSESTIQMRWVEPGQNLGTPDVLIIPGSKQTIKDLESLKKTGLSNQIKDYANNGGNIFGICGGLQMLGKSLEDPNRQESNNNLNSFSYIGMNLLSIKTTFGNIKHTAQREEIASWPKTKSIEGFEMHYGESHLIDSKNPKIISIFKNNSLGWVLEKKDKSFIGGTYLHGIFENEEWRREWINKVREKKGLEKLNLKGVNNNDKREKLLDLLSDSFEENINIDALIKI
ncbi:cobyric acid synthase [Prochlorococcus marinus]|uniref:Cobyric acid synthase n=1 Tax=Prochlorococcus marinus XMU1408 TaxID=2213228 RepID=A0A318RDZ1_PROMR|nr:cobyric acid synthase [Prochlorococcus marinus]MBW3042378.1 cobyric acid synthase CobQ [Prochlorococcus marinus str. XMU1408]PYE01432.1 cobyric acid synthase CobQ [Prochlorococcus marinus XMU1408]